MRWFHWSQVVGFTDTSRARGVPAIEGAKFPRTTVRRLLAITQKRRNPDAVRDIHIWRSRVSRTIRAWNREAFQPEQTMSAAYQMEKNPAFVHQLNVLACSCLHTAVVHISSYLRDIIPQLPVQMKAAPLSGSSPAR
jgi:hypothetical protein